MKAVADTLAHAAPPPFPNNSQAPLRKLSKPSGTRPSSKRMLPYNCERCRKDKTKCDKTWPKCRRCVRKGFECISVVTKRGRPAKTAEDHCETSQNRKRKIPSKMAPKSYTTSKKLRRQYYQQQSPPNISTNNIMALQGGRINTMQDVQAIDLLRSAASMELLSDKNLSSLHTIQQGRLLAQQDQKEQEQRQRAAALLSHQQQQFFVQQQAHAAASLAHQQAAFNQHQHNLLSGYAVAPSQIQQQQQLLLQQQQQQQQQLHSRCNVKAVARSLLLSNMWVYFRDQDYQGIAQGYIAAQQLNLDFNDFGKNCHNVLSNMNMCGNYSFHSPMTIASDDKIKLEIIKLSHDIERSMYPCVYFCNLYGHSFHLTNGKMKRFIKSDKAKLEAPVPVTQAGNNDAENNISSNVESTSNGYPVGNPSDGDTLNAWQRRNLPQSPFKKMIESIFHCSDSKKNEIAATFMENALMKSNQVVKSYFDNMPPIPSFETTFTYDNIPILDHETSALKETTLLVNLSRTMNGEMFIHKVHFTNIRGRVMNLPSNFVSTNRFGIQHAYNSAATVKNDGMAINKSYHSTIVNNNNPQEKVAELAHIESKSTPSVTAPTGIASPLLSPASSSLARAKEDIAVHRSSTLATGVHKHNDAPTSAISREIDGNKLKKYIPNAVLSNIFD